MRHPDPETSEWTVLRWVLVDGKLHYVGDYDHLKPGHRPLAFCPVCEAPVVLRLGKKRVYHAAHKPGAECIATRPETALHLDAKWYLAEQLRRTNSLQIQTVCDRCKREYEQRVSSYLSGWDDVQVEFSIDSYRPDVTLLKNGEPIGAVEVYVSSSVTQEKANFLAKIPWVEVQAKHILWRTSSRSGWTPDKPLPFRNINWHFVEKWHCEDCKTELQRIRLEEEQREYEKQFVTTAVRIVDFYYPQFKHYRKIYFARKRVVQGSIVEISVIEDRGGMICCIKNPLFPADRKGLWRAFEDYLESKRSSEDCMIDSHMLWQKWDTSSISVTKLRNYRYKSLFPKRYCWDNDKQDWKLLPDFGELDWNLYFENPDAYRSSLLALRDQAFSSGRFAQSRKKLNQKNKVQAGAGSQSTSDLILFPKKAGVCRTCGRTTTEWWRYDNKTGECDCYDCLHKSDASRK